MRGLFEEIRGAIAGSRASAVLGLICAGQHMIVQRGKTCYQLALVNGEAAYGAASSVSVDGKIFRQILFENPNRMYDVF
jgi:hypothetical protein